MSAPAVERIAVNIGTRDGAVRAELVVPKAMRLAHLAYAVGPIAEQLAALAARRSSKEEAPVSCRARCAGCCRQLVPVSPAEAFFLNDLVASMQEPKKSELVARFAEANDAYEASGLRAREEAGGDLTSIALDWQRKAIACPFLHEELCSIYAHRPAGCREYLVVTPRENCYQLGRAPITRVPLAAVVSEALQRTCANVLGLSDGVIPLPTALAWAKAHATDDARTWDGRRLVDTFVRELG